MVADVAKSFVTGIYEKFNSPLAGTFIGVWIATNWKLVSYYLFSDEPMLMKIQFISENYICFEKNLWIPLVSTLVLIAIYAPLSVAVFWFWEKAQSVKTNLYYTIKDTVPYPLETGIALEKELKNMKQESFAERQEYEKTIENLRKEIIKRESSYNEKISEYRDQMNEQDEVIQDQAKYIENNIPLESDGKEYAFEDKDNISNNNLNRSDKENKININKYITINGSNFASKDFLIACEKIIESKVLSMELGETVTIKDILEEEGMWKEIPRLHRMNVDSTFYNMVSDNKYFPELKYLGTDKAYNVYARIE